MKITAVIPVYKDPRDLKTILERLLFFDYPAKEIVVVVDGATNEAIESILDLYRQQIRVHYNGIQKGKVMSLNDVVPHLETDTLLFIDNDIVFPQDKYFLKKLSVYLENNEIVELPKEARVNTFVSAMMSYEFMSFTMATYVLAKLSGHSPSMNGACFAIRKDWFEKMGGFHRVINEDMDLAARSFIHHARFAFPPELKVTNGVPDTVKDWVIQRKRWALNNVLWFKRYFGEVLKKIVSMSSLLMAIGVFVLPMVAYVVAYILIHFLRLHILGSLLFLVSHAWSFTSALLFMFLQYGFLAWGNYIPFLLSFLVTMVSYRLVARRFAMRFKWYEFVVYYLVYLPLWTVINMVFFVLVLFDVEVQTQWKI